MTAPFTDPQVPIEMHEQFISQTKRLPDEFRALQYAYLVSAYIWGVQHGYERHNDR